jgi:ubiquinone/menaquinone biosynthesis C-methylase UbiE
MIEPLVSPAAAPAYGGSFGDGLSAQNRLTWSQERALLRRHGLTHGMVVASVGCGCGHFEMRLAEELRLRQIAALDRDPQAIAQATARNQSRRLRFEAGDATCLPWPDASFDFTICRHALQTMPRTVRNEALQELVRVTRPGGRIYLTNEKNSHCTGTPNARTIDAAFHLVADLWEEYEMDIECGPEQAGWLRGLGLDDLRIDQMTISSLESPEAFADVASCWRSAFLDMAREAGWRGSRLMTLNNGLSAYQQAALEGYASWPIWVASARRPG